MKNNIQLSQCQQVLPFTGTDSDLNRWNVTGLKAGKKISGAFGLAENQQPAGGLRIEKDGRYLG